MERKSQKIYVVVAAEKYLGERDFSAEDLQEVLRKRVLSTSLWPGVGSFRVK